MSGAGEREERCETCRFWVSESAECRRRAPAVLCSSPLGPEPGGVSLGVRATGSWPITSANQWCGEWAVANDRTRLTNPAVNGECVAIRVFLARVAPTLDTQDPSLLGSLLDQLPSDVRQVLTRSNGLDGRPPAGLREVAREFKMSQGHVRALLATGEALLAEVIGLLTQPRGKA